jgi:hypothetical protein
MPAAVAVSAAGMERFPERHRKTAGPADTRAASSCAKFTLGLPSEWTHSMQTTSRSRPDKSGSPTKRHSASVRTSMSVAVGLSRSSAQACSGVMSPA